MTLASRERSGDRAAHATYARDRAHAMAVLARRCSWLDHGEREAIFHDAYLMLLQKQHDGAIDLASMNDHQTRAYLVRTALNKALDEGKRAGRARERSLDADLDAGLEPADVTAAPDEQAVSRQTSMQVREIVADLPERQQTIVKLRFFFDRTPEEIQRFLGLNERIYRRELERAMRELSAGVELVREGGYCESRRSAILALVAGIAGPNRARDAREHVASCPACARWAVALRDSTREAAALLPLPTLALASPHRFARLWESARDAVAGSTSSAKQHAAEAATRLDAATAGSATSLRPGALAAAAAGCLALGGGATYCVVEGVPEPIRALVGADGPSADRDAAVDRARDRDPASAAASSATPTTAAAPPAVQRAQRRSADRAAQRVRRRIATQQRRDRRRVERQRAAAGQPSGAQSGTAATPGSTPGAPSSASAPSSGTSPEQAAAREFGAEGSGVPVTPAPAAPPTRPTSPPPAPAGDEFGP